MHNQFTNEPIVVNLELNLGRLPYKESLDICCPSNCFNEKKIFFFVNRKRFAFFIRLPFIDFGDFPAIKGFF